MYVSDILAKLREIRNNANNPEEAHLLEDKLYVSVLEHIASGICRDPATYANEALKARKIKFPRWYA